jgi:uncharacterized membrane protein
MIPRTHLVILILIELAIIAVSAILFPLLPDPVATHYNLRGEPDAYGSPWTLALLMPIMAAVLIGLLTGLPLLGPFRSNFEEFRVIYGRVCIAALTSFLGIHLVIMLKGAEYPIDIGRALAIILGLLFAVLGNWFGKIRRNFYVGIRTPWTIANDEVWERTHRVGGRLFAIVGVASVVSGLLAPAQVCFFVLIGGVVIASVWSVLYSIYWYRRLGQVDDMSRV